MTDPDFRILGYKDIPDLVNFIIPICIKPAQHCIHSWAGDEVDELISDLRKLHSDGELIYSGIYKDNRLTAALGCEFEVELGRGWLLGPHSISGDYSKIPALFTYLRTSLPEKISIFDSFPNLANTGSQKFYLSQGFAERDHNTHQYVLRRKDFCPSDSEYKFADFSPEFKPSFKYLYNKLFPNTYYSANRIIELNGQRHQIFLNTVDGETAAFVIANRSEDKTRGEIDFLGVAEKYRKTGIGSGLLSKAVAWVFSDLSVKVISLTVNDNLSGARSLYAKHGFKLKYSGVGMRFEFKSAEAPDD